MKIITVKKIALKWNEKYKCFMCVCTWENKNEMKEKGAIEWGKCMRVCCIFVPFLLFFNFNKDTTRR